VNTHASWYISSNSSNNSVFSDGGTWSDGYLMVQCSSENSLCYPRPLHLFWPFCSFKKTPTNVLEQDFLLPFLLFFLTSLLPDKQLYATQQLSPFLRICCLWVTWQNCQGAVSISMNSANFIPLRKVQDKIQQIPPLHWAPIHYTLLPLQFLSLEPGNFVHWKNTWKHNAFMEFASPSPYPHEELPWMKF